MWYCVKLRVNIKTPHIYASFEELAASSLKSHYVIYVPFILFFLTPSMVLIVVLKMMFDALAIIDFFAVFNFWFSFGD